MRIKAVDNMNMIDSNSSYLFIYIRRKELSTDNENKTKFFCCKQNGLNANYEINVRFRY